MNLLLFSGSHIVVVVMQQRLKVSGLRFATGIFEPNMHIFVILGSVGRVLFAAHFLARCLLPLYFGCKHNLHVREGLEEFGVLS